MSQDVTPWRDHPWGTWISRRRAQVSHTEMFFSQTDILNTCLFRQNGKDLIQGEGGIAPTVPYCLTILLLVSVPYRCCLTASTTWPVWSVTTLLRLITLRTTSVLIMAITWTTGIVGLVSNLFRGPSRQILSTNSAFKKMGFFLVFKSWIHTQPLGSYSGESKIRSVITETCLHWLGWNIRFIQFLACMLGTFLPSKFGFSVSVWLLPIAGFCFLFQTAVGGGLSQWGCYWRRWPLSLWCGRWCSWRVATAATATSVPAVAAAAAGSTTRNTRWNAIS